MADPFAILQNSQFNLPQIMSSVSETKQNRLREMMLNRKAQQQEKLEQTREKASDLYRSGNRKAARDEAISGGDFDFADHMSKLDTADLEAVKRRAEAIGNIAQWADDPAKWDQGVDFLVAQGYSDLAAYKGKFSPSARMAALASAGQVKDYYDRTKPVNMAPGGRLVDPTTGRVISEAPFAPRAVTVGEGQTVVEYQPGAGGAGGGDLSVEGLRPHFVAQESGGDYSDVNKETGALGAYQVMPQTGQTLAGRLGLPWRPDLMVASTPEGKQYQDAVGGAAIEEAVNAGGGDLDTTAMYYHGGSNREGWGPRTRQYAEDMRARVGGGGGAGSRVIAQGAPKPAKEWHTLTPEETQQAGLPPGVYQRGPNNEIKPVAGTTGKNAPQDKEAYSASAMDAFNRAIDSADRLLKHPGFSTAVGMKGVTGGLLGGWVVPGTDAADFRAELEALKAQVFLPMVQSMKGMGALSNAEGDKLTASIGSLDPNMSEGGFRASLNRIIRDLNTYKSRAARPTQKAGPKPSVSNW